MQRQDIRLSPEWDKIIFVDSYSALIMGGKVIMKSNIDWVRYYLYPTDELLKRYELVKDVLDDNGCIFMEYPKEFIITLNEDDPSRKVKFCFLNFEGKRTPTTEKLLGAKANIDDIDKIIDLWAKENYINSESVLKLKSLIVPKCTGSEPDKIMNLKKRIFELTAENAYLSEQNFIARTNQAKYVKDNFLAIADAVMPMINKATELQKEGMEQKRGGI